MLQHTTRPSAGQGRVAPRTAPAALVRCPLRQPAGQTLNTTQARAQPSAQDDATDSKGSLGGARQLGEDLDARILSGEFSDTGSTKEKLTRPVRQFLAKDPVVGEMGRLGVGLLGAGRGGGGGAKANGAPPRPSQWRCPHPIHQKP